jgi:hypothetical protein
MLCPDP